MNGQQGFMATLISYVVFIGIGLFFIGLDIADFSWIIMITCSLFWLGVMKITNRHQKRMSILCKKLNSYYRGQ